MNSVYKSISKSIFKSVHHPLRVPAALLGGAAFNIESGLQHRYLDDETSQTLISNKWYVSDSAGSNDALVKVPCLSGAEGTSMRAEIGLFELDADFEISCWIKYEGSNTTANGPMFFGGGLSTSGAAYQANVWYRPSTGLWYLTVDGNANRINGVSNTTIEDNQWHFLQARRIGTLYQILLDNSVIASATGVVTRFSLRWIMNSYAAATYSFKGLMSDFKVNNAGVITHFPLQDGEGSGSNTNLAWHRSDGASGVVSGALVGYTVASWWGGKTSGHVKDWSMEYGGRIGAGGEFIIGNITGDNCADGNAKTLAVGKLGNPFSRLNLNYGYDDTLSRRAVPSEFGSAQNLNSFVAPFDSAFNRISADGTDRILIYSTAKIGSDLTSLRDYTGVSAPTAWTLSDLPGEIATEYFAAIAANSGTISAGNQTAVSNLLNGLHTQGLFDDVLALYLFHGNHLNAARLNVINPTTVNGSGIITWTGSPTLNASGGITPSVGNFGVAFHPHYIGLQERTNFGGAGLGFYSTSNSATSERTIGNTVSFYLAPKYSATSEVCMSSSALTGTVQDLSGFHFGTREPSSSNVAAYRDGVSYLTGTVAYSSNYTPGVDTALVHIGGCRSSTSNLASTTPIRLAICTKGLLAAQVASLNTLIQTYISELV